MNPKEHWEKVYLSKPSTEVSWYQARLTKSLELIAAAGIEKEARIIDVGGGASTLAEDLLANGYHHLTVLDISSEALNQSKKRLGEKSKKITCLEADILTADLPKNVFDLWHDRAVFHFLTNPKDRKTYLEVMKQSLKPDGFLIIASFSLEGPQKCSGLEVMRYSPDTLSQELEDAFVLLKTFNERHQTPFGTFQNFIYCLFQKTPQGQTSGAMNKL